MVAGFAFPPLLAFVFVILLVTRETIGLQFVLVQVTFVTADAFCIPVFAQQRVFGFLVMVEDNLFPAFFDMASFAFRTKAALMLIVFFMARKAIHLQFVFI